MTPCILASSFWTSGIGSFLLMIVGFGLVVFFHELGHFLVAKWVGIYVEEFAIGFGPKLWGFRWGETLYRLNALPLGGYVKMLGQSDFETKDAEESDPRAYNNRPIWARLLTVSAGVAMNVVLAGLLFVVVFTVGIRYKAPVVGYVRPGFPADQVQLPDGLGTGLKAGDRILAIDGEPIRKFDNLMIAATLSDAGQMFEMLVERPGVDQPFSVKLGTKETDAPGASGATTHSFGIVMATDRVLSDDDASDAFVRQLTGDKLQGGDVIVRFAGQDIAHGWQISRLREDLTADEIEIEVERPAADGSVTRHAARLRPNLQWSPGYVAQAYEQWKTQAHTDGDAEDASAEASPILPLSVLGLQPRMRVIDLAPDGPAAEAGMRIGDIIASAGDGGQVPTGEGFETISREYVGSKMPIRLLRDGKVADVEWVQVRRLGGRARIGIVWGPDSENLVVAGVLAGTPLADSIPSGSKITALNDTPVTTWPQLIRAAADLADQDDATVALTYDTPGGRRQTTEPAALAELGFDPTRYAYDVALPTLPLRGPPVREGPLGALKLGVSETGDFIVLTYATLKQFIKGRVSGKQFSGPVGIFRAGVSIGSRGVVWVIWLLAIISANLAVINFLPLPIVDGGHVVFLLIEKVRRKPLSIRVQNAVQIAGLAMIIVVFVLLTYNDIAQWVSGIWR